MTGHWQGWAVGLAVQPVWIAFGLVTHGYGLCLSSVLYGTVYARNVTVPIEDYKRIVTTTNLSA